ncbi:hypothetical protein J6I90_10385 [Pseudidiomarina sp. 1APP75-32.1]|uniref:Uncharacterized protein n=1 Tax=Pseudidiomarina terrestris TaxID=2820060 RepID=A0AAW7R1Z4_9GAMM|nr:MULTISPECIES: hypothetical protein [unclassified Pseudidiomarina]MDN7125289.1 hypothetical protein [Pseudidiomarina sp. 1APP75-32.1]MDN7130048.1 hypothetical protein [Pseudidiomarina sp. 1APR75-15]
MTSQFDVLALSETVSRDSQSGKLSRDLLAQGQTLYGKNVEFPDFLERVTPDGRKSLGHWSNGEFQQVISLL